MLTEHLCPPMLAYDRQGDGPDFFAASLLRVQPIANEMSSLSRSTRNCGVTTWQHIQYVVLVSGGERYLLDNVSGCVAPGKLMGESDVEKVSILRNPPLIWFSPSEPEA